jgi:hypothetical protein
MLVNAFEAYIIINNTVSVDSASIKVYLDRSSCRCPSRSDLINSRSHKFFKFEIKTKFEK